MVVYGCQWPCVFRHLVTDHVEVAYQPPDRASPSPAPVAAPAAPETVLLAVEERATHLLLLLLL